MDRVYKEERNYILSLVKRIKAAGVNVLLIQKSILRDAVTDLSLHYLVRGGIYKGLRWSGGGGRQGAFGGQRQGDVRGGVDGGGCRTLLSDAHTT